MSRNYNFNFSVVCAGEGEADLTQVEEMLNLAMQELVMDDNFIVALDEKEAVTIEVKLVK